MTVLVIVGPTAVGKSTLSVLVAQEFARSGKSAEIISADSMQAYIGMNIGTATPTQEERGGIAHHLLDVWPSDHVLTVSQYQETARTAIDEVLSKGALPIVVGGSGLYVAAILDDLQFPATDPEIRAKFETQLEELGARAMHRQLALVDPVAAAQIGQMNGRRVVRALEVLEVTGEKFIARLPEPVELYQTIRVGLEIPREQMDERIALRVHQMFDDGFVDEVRVLSPKDYSVTATRAIGYTQVLEFLAGECTQEEAVTATIAITKKFARRQQRWFRQDKRIIWMDYDEAGLASRVCALLGEDTKQ